LFRFPNEQHGKCADSYTLGKQLGSGAFSRVVVGVKKNDPDANKKFAIKIVDKQETNAKEMWKELHVMSQLNHPNIVNFKEIFDQPDGYYVVLELITGGELFDRIIELKRYTEKDASHVITQALLGVKHMHEKKIAHRDIKPENLLLSSKSEDEVVKVADFGFSKDTNDDFDLWETLGTPPYMAPEIVILRNDEATNQVGYGRPVDVWALGICLYILLSGIHPYQQESDDKMLDEIEAGFWPGWKRESTWSQISDSAKSLVRAMMNPSVSERPTVNQCLEHEWLQGSASTSDLHEIKEALKSYQARIKLRGTVLGVLATHKMGRITSLQNPKQPATTTTTTNVTNKEAQSFSSLRVNIIGGRNLAAKDLNGLSDPFLTVWCGVSKYKTSVQKKTLYPNWNESFTLSSASCAKKDLEIECWDDSPGEFMGETKISIDSLPIGTTKEWFKLYPNVANKSKKGHVSGEICLEIIKS